MFGTAGNFGVAVLPSFSALSVTLLHDGFPMRTFVALWSTSPDLAVDELLTPVETQLGFGIIGWPYP